jgi:hypothetical protein
MDSKSIYKNAYSIHYKEKNFDKALPLNHSHFDGHQIVIV